MLFDRLLLASGNRHKYQEFLELLPKDLVKELVFAPKVAPLEVDETGTTYAMNAILKAQAWAEASGLPSLADDSGIELEALAWRPGVRSARIVEGSDADRNRWLLEQMRGRSNRRAHFVAALALVVPNQWALVCEGVCSGRLAEDGAGGGGFGYDPLFIPDGYDATLAEVSPALKNKISHRAKATETLLEILRQDFDARF
ncbi:MAG: RdgB/HAM1 family non-canonical purine NTP pyrophosphatase [Synergistaceae bacterium]|nr:RdgB/HAM1 family non-canonical purine NTP pyrophosphatase [Synergistaceae bacterium]